MSMRRIITWLGSNTVKKVPHSIEMENLSPEILFQILLHLPYSDIESYCLTSRSAKEVCGSKYFWEQKARLLPFPLSVIPEESPMKQYMILKTLLDLSPSQAAQIAIANGYSKLIKYFLQQEYDTARMIPISQIQTGLLEAVRNDHLDSIITTRDFLIHMFFRLGYYPDDLNWIFNPIYIESIRLKRKEIQDVLKGFSRGNLITVLDAAFSTHQYNLTEVLMNELISTDPETVRDILDDLLSEAITNDDLNLVQYLVERYREFIDLDSHLRAAQRREHYSIAKYLDQI